jgi:hypothetical protein
MWPDSWGVRMEHILRNVLMALLEQPNSTLHDVLRIFSDKIFRTRIAGSLRNKTVRAFLLHQFEKFSFGYRADGTAPIQNKVGAFLADPLLYRILTASEEDLHIRHIMDEVGVLLVNLGKGELGEDTSSLLGGLLVTTIRLADVQPSRHSTRKTAQFFSSTSMNFKASRPWPWPTCSQNLENIALASLLLINICTNSNRKFVTQFWATLAQLFVSA